MSSMVQYVCNYPVWGWEGGTEINRGSHSPVHSRACSCLYMPHINIKYYYSLRMMQGTGAGARRRHVGIPSKINLL